MGGRKEGVGWTPEVEKFRISYLAAREDLENFMSIRFSQKKYVKLGQMERENYCIMDFLV